MDFLAFSGHKLLSPMGIGVLYGKRALLEEMPPFLTGGEMIESVSLEKVVYAPLPQKFEAGTVNTAGAIALGAAIDYLTDIGFEETMAQEHLLTKRTMDGIGQIPIFPSSVQRIPQSITASLPSRSIGSILTIFLPSWRARASPSGPDTTVPSPSTNIWGFPLLPVPASCSTIRLRK